MAIIHSVLHRRVRAVLCPTCREFIWVEKGRMGEHSCFPEGLDLSNHPSMPRKVK